MKIIRPGLKTEATKWSTTMNCFECSGIFEVEKEDIYASEIKMAGEVVGRTFNTKCPCCGSKLQLDPDLIPYGDAVQSYTSWANKQLKMYVSALYKLDPVTWSERKKHLPEGTEIQRACTELGL